MTLNDILEVMQAGTKVRSDAWRKIEYLRLDKSVYPPRFMVKAYDSEREGELLLGNGLDAEDIMAEDWEVVE